VVDVDEEAPWPEKIKYFEIYAFFYVYGLMMNGIARDDEIEVAERGGLAYEFRPVMSSKVGLHELGTAAVPMEHHSCLIEHWTGEVEEHGPGPGMGLKYMGREDAVTRAEIEEDSYILPLDEAQHGMDLEVKAGYGPSNALEKDPYLLISLPFLINTLHNDCSSLKDKI